MGEENGDGVGVECGIWSDDIISDQSRPKIWRVRANAIIVVGHDHNNASELSRPLTASAYMSSL